MRRRRCVSSKKCEFLWRLRNTVTRRSAKMSEPKYAGTKRKNNSQYTSYLLHYLAAGTDWGEWLTLVLNRVILSDLIDLAWPTAFKILDSQNQKIRGLQGLMPSWSSACHYSGWTYLPWLNRPTLEIFIRNFLIRNQAQILEYLRNC